MLNRNRREDYFLPVTISAGPLQVKNVLCKVFLPLRKTDRLFLDFYPNSKQAQKLKRVPKFTLNGKITSLDNSMTRIQAKEVYSHGVSSSYWGPRIHEDSMSADPIDLTITHVNKSGNYVASDRCVGNFWITSCSLLNSAGIISRSYTGNVKMTAFRKLRFVLSNGYKLTFARHYRYKKTDDGEEDVTLSEQVAEFDFVEKRRKLFKVHEALGQLEEVLRLSSFAARYRCACVGWTLTSGNRLIRHFRRNVTIPKRVDQRGDEELIDLAYFPEFIRTAYKRFTANDFKENLGRAIDYAIPKSERTLESSFVSLFAALETLISGFRSVRGFEVVLPRSDWKRIEASLKAHLSLQAPFDSDVVIRQLVFQKLPELNRISLAVAIQEFCKVYRVSLDDLWPLIGSDPGGPSLSSIRNKLVHGKVFRRDHHIALVIAGEHLQWALERMILAVLGWNTNKSRVAPGYLSHFTAYKDWKALRLSLTK